jgi:endonuclease YncB( thermonuclease family)
MGLAEIVARENRRGLWSGQLVTPDEWRAGKWLTGEK